MDLFFGVGAGGMGELKKGSILETGRFLGDPTKGLFSCKLNGSSNSRILENGICVHSPLFSYFSSRENWTL